MAQIELIKRIGLIVLKSALSASSAVGLRLRQILLPGYARLDLIKYGSDVCHRNEATT